MDLNTTVKVNRQIMALIKSKYPDDFPLGYRNPDAQYFDRLADEILKAERFLGPIPRSTTAALEEVAQGAGARTASHRRGKDSNRHLVVGPS